MDKKKSLILAIAFSLCLILSGCDAEAFRKKFHGRFLGKNKQKTNSDSKLENARKGKSTSQSKATKSKKRKKSGRKDKRKSKKKVKEEAQPERMFGFDEERKRREKIAQRKRK